MRTSAPTCSRAAGVWALPGRSSGAGDQGRLAGEEAAAPGSQAEWGRAFRTHGTCAEVLGPPEGWTVLGGLEGGPRPGWGGHPPVAHSRGPQGHGTTLASSARGTCPAHRVPTRGHRPRRGPHQAGLLRPPGFQNVRESRVPRVPLPRASPALAPQHPPEGLLYPVAHFADGEPEAPVRSHTAGARGVLAWGQAFL